MRIIKIDRGSIEIDLEGYVLRIAGEAIMPKQLPELSEYVLYRNSMRWLDNKSHPAMDEKILFSFLEKELLKRNLRLIIE
jgi:hypothetical protein